MADLTKAEFGDVLTLFCLFNIQVLLIESKKKKCGPVWCSKFSSSAQQLTVS